MRHVAVQDLLGFTVPMGNPASCRCWYARVELMILYLGDIIVVGATFYFFFTVHHVMQA